VIGTTGGTYFSEVGFSSFDPAGGFAPYSIDVDQLAISSFSFPVSIYGGASGVGVDIGADGSGSIQFTGAAGALPPCAADANYGKFFNYFKDINNVFICFCQKVGGAYSWVGLGGASCT
jgi:hypothetical protein